MGNNMFKRKKSTPIEHIEVGGFVCNFYFKEDSIVDSYMEIRSELGSWSIKIDARYELYGYLLAAAKQGMKEQIHGYCATIYMVSTQMTQDQGFVNDIQKSISKYIKRIEKKAETEAKKVTETQIIADEVLMQEAIERGKTKGNKKAEKKASKASKQEMKKILEEDKNEK